MPRLAHDERRLCRLRPAGDEDVQPDDDASVDQPSSTSTSVEAISSFATSSPDAGVAATPLAGRRGSVGSMPYHPTTARKPQPQMSV